MKKLVLVLALTVAACHQTSVQYRPEIRRESAALRDSVFNLFASYENEDPVLFESLLASDLRDNSGNNYLKLEMGNAAREDFRNLDGVFFNVFVESVRKVEGGQQISIVWSRRASVPLGGEEWMVPRGATRLTFTKDGDAWKLSLIEGDPIFGLSDRTGAIRIQTGTINGADASGRSISGGRLAS